MSKIFLDFICFCEYPIVHQLETNDGYFQYAPKCNKCGAKMAYNGVKINAKPEE